MRRNIYVLFGVIILSLLIGCRKQNEGTETGPHRAEPVSEKQTSPVQPSRTAEEKVTRSDYAHFSKWGLSFDYPKEWQEHPANQVTMMKEYIS